MPTEHTVLNGLVQFLDERGCLDIADRSVYGPRGHDPDMRGRPLPSEDGENDTGILDVKTLTSDDDCEGDRFVREGEREEEYHGPNGELIVPTHPNEGGRNNDPVNWRTIAWYQPVHFFGYTCGIYILEDGLNRLAAEVASVLLWAKHPPDHKLWRRALRIAFGFLYLHEAFHHKVESFGFRAHVLNGVGCYRGYNKMVYRRTYGTDACLEEALANAEAYLRMKNESKWFKGLNKKQEQSILDHLQWKLNHGPPGYRRWSKHVPPDFNFNDGGQYLLQSQIKEMTVSPCGPEHDWSVAPNLIRSILNIESQVMILVPRGKTTSLPCLVSPAPPVTPRQTISFLVSRGFHEKTGRGKGSHRMLHHPGPPPRTHTIPCHGSKELSIKVLTQIAKKEGQFAREFSEAIRRH